MKKIQKKHNDYGSIYNIVLSEMPAENEFEMDRVLYIALWEASDKPTVQHIDDTYGYNIKTPFGIAMIVWSGK